MTFQKSGPTAQYSAAIAGPSLARIKQALSYKKPAFSPRRQHRLCVVRQCMRGFLSPVVRLLYRSQRAIVATADKRPSSNV
jgi:hypothetical protein